MNTSYTSADTKEVIELFQIQYALTCHTPITYGEALAIRASGSTGSNV